MSKKRLKIKKICKKCGSSYTYLTKKEIVCRNCGFREKRDDIDG